MIDERKTKKKKKSNTEKKLNWIFLLAQLNVDVNSQISPVTHLK